MGLLQAALLGLYGSLSLVKIVGVRKSIAEDLGFTVAPGVSAY